MFSEKNRNNIEKDLAKFIHWIITGQVASNYEQPYVLCDAYEAFIFSEITGSFYLDGSAMPFTPRGLMKVFHSALKDDTVVGLFEDGKPKYTPQILAAERPYIFAGHKKIYPIAASTNQELETKVKKLDHATKRGEALIMRIDTSKKGFGLESILEAAACFDFRRSGYVVESQVPIGHGIGSPDFLAIKQSTGHTGCHFIEFAMLRQAFQFKKPLPQAALKDQGVPLKAPILVGEAKTATSIMDAQVNKYKKSEMFDFAYEIHYSIERPRGAENGLLAIDKWALAEKVAPSQLHVDKIKQQSYIAWLERAKNIYLLANFSLEELSSLGNNLCGRKFTNSSKWLLELAEHPELQIEIEKRLAEIKNGPIER